MTTRPVTLVGVVLPEGAKVFLWIAASGRDPAVFREPEVFDLERPNANRHLAFGKGWTDASANGHSPDAVEVIRMHGPDGEDRAGAAGAVCDDRSRFAVGHAGCNCSA